MKKLSLLMLFSISLLQGWAQLADFDLNILMDRQTLMKNTTGYLNVSSINNGTSSIVANSILIKITMASNAEITGIKPGSDARFTIRSLTSGSGNSIELTNSEGPVTGSEGANPSVSIDLEVKGITLSSPMLIIGDISYLPGANALLGGADNTTQGNSPGNDHSTTTLGISTALPVGIRDFKATKTGAQVFLSWNYDNAVTFSHFELERSADGFHFTNLLNKQYKASASQAGVQFSINETDSKPLNGGNYYRLKLVDIDGSYSYSYVVQINTNGTHAAISLYPNPAINAVTIETTGLNNTGRLKIYNVFGAVVYSGNATPKTTLNTSGFAPGAYTVEVYGAQDQRLSSTKFLKMNK